MGFKEQMKAARKDLSNAQKNLKDVKAAKESNLKAIDSKIKAAERALNNPLCKQSGVQLYVDHIEYRGTNYRLDPSTKVEVAASGVKLENKDNRRLYLTVQTIDGTFVAQCNPDFETSVRNLGAAILNQAPNAEKNTAELQGAIQQLKVQRNDIDADYSSIDNAQADIDAKQSVIDELMANASEEERAALVKADKIKKVLKIVALAIAALLVIAIGFGIASGGSTNSTPTGTKQEQSATNANKSDSSKKSAGKLSLKDGHPLNGLKVHVENAKGSKGKYAYIKASKKKTLGMNSGQFNALSKYLKTVNYKWFTVDFGDGTGLYIPACALKKGSCLDLDKQKSQKKNGKVYGHVKLSKKNGKSTWKYIKA